MKRRNFLTTTAQATAYTFLFSQLYACKTKSKFIAPVGKDYNMQILRGGVGYFTERGGTIGWMATKDGIVVVDTQFPDQANHLLAEIDKLDLGNIDLLINTHHHGDHTAGNPVFKDRTDMILAHSNSRKNQEASAIKRGTEDQQVYPTDTFQTSLSKKVGSETITLNYHGAGHTDGDALVHFENANVVHLGDLLFNRRFPYIDMSAGANIENWIKVLDKAKNNYDDKTIYMWGHAGEGYDITGGKEEIKAFQNYLEKLLEFGEKSLRASVPLEKLKETTTVIPGAEEWTGKGIERSLDAVYAELARE
ncbi:MAG: cyclase [Saprospiraceae bacterium]|jgi:cyclase|tara:strand:+ start:939 stop:1859 length:921 start_codon:yes stop_codon:yes gene_type:complete